MQTNALQGNLVALIGILEGRMGLMYLLNIHKYDTMLPIVNNCEKQGVVDSKGVAPMGQSKQVCGVTSHTSYASFSKVRPFKEWQDHELINFAVKKLKIKRADLQINTQETVFNAAMKNQDKDFLQPVLAMNAMQMMSDKGIVSFTEEVDKYIFGVFADGDHFSTWALSYKQCMSKFAEVIGEMIWSQN